MPSIGWQTPVEVSAMDDARIFRLVAQQRRFEFRQGEGPQGRSMV